MGYNRETMERRQSGGRSESAISYPEERSAAHGEEETGASATEMSSPAPPPGPRVRGNRQGTTNVFSYGVSRSRLERAIHELGVPANICRDVRDAHVLITLKSHFKNEPNALRGADGVPVFVIKSNTYVQIANALRDIFQLGSQDVEEQAMQEAEEAIEVVTTNGQALELLPQSAYIRRLQHQLVEKYKLLSESVGTEPNRRLRIFKG